jgi:hypothetical protein
MIVSCFGIGFSIFTEDYETEVLFSHGQYKQ